MQCFGNTVQVCKELLKYSLLAIRVGKMVAKVEEALLSVSLQQFPKPTLISTGSKT